MKEIIELLKKGNYSCVIENGEILTFDKSGVADIYDLLIHEPHFLIGASIADKVVGKAAASLMIVGGIKRLYAEIISVPALELLRESAIDIDFARQVPYIQNRDHSGWCPLERICYTEKSAHKNVELIKEFIEKIQIKTI